MSGSLLTWGFLGKPLILTYPDPDISMPSPQHCPGCGTHWLEAAALPQLHISALPLSYFLFFSPSFYDQQ